MAEGSATVRAYCNALRLRRRPNAMQLAITVGSLMHEKYAPICRMICWPWVTQQTACGLRW